jgi:hypothetical protein
MMLTQGYKNESHKGYIDGFKDSTACKEPRTFIMIYYGPDTGYKGGYFNGYRDSTVMDIEKDTVMDI